MINFKKSLLLYALRRFWDVKIFDVRNDDAVQETPGNSNLSKSWQISIAWAVLEVV